MGIQNPPEGETFAMSVFPCAVGILGRILLGPLMGGGGVPMSPVDFKKTLCHMSV